jgi:hypothetical protein
MLPALILSCAIIASNTSAQADWTTTDWGRYCVTTFASAPFPHSSRADGYKHAGKVYSVSHYQDSSVAVLVPTGAPSSGRVDIVLYIHGYNNDIRKNLQDDWLQNCMRESRTKAIMLFPQGPRNAPDSEFGKLAEQGGLHRFLNEAMQFLDAQTIVKKPRIGRVVLASHSGGYLLVGRILADPSQFAIISEVDLLDSTYGELEQLASGALSKDMVFRSVFTKHLADRNVDIMARLNRARRSYKVMRDEDATENALRKNRNPVFIYSNMAHREVRDFYLPRFLKTGAIRARGKSAERQR